ncbi:MAG: hypothetical protein J7L26_08485 [Candidatus Aminicenantes bacterium]|nr:hypothetical protein [Candidatus Aminicenantes bacterium]
MGSSNKNDACFRPREQLITPIPGYPKISSFRKANEGPTLVHLFIQNNNVHQGEGDP